MAMTIYNKTFFKHKFMQKNRYKYKKFLKVRY